MSTFRRIVITQTDDGYLIDEETEDSKWPQTRKETAREAVARVMQLLGVGPVAPQIDPEEACIGSVETE